MTCPVHWQANTFLLEFSLNDSKMFNVIWPYGHGKSSELTAMSSNCLFRLTDSQKLQIYSFNSDKEQRKTMLNFTDDKLLFSTCCSVSLVNCLNNQFIIMLIHTELSVDQQRPFHETNDGAHSDTTGRCFKSF